MRGVVCALLASGVLSIGTLVSGPAAAGCYGGDCDEGYRSGPPTTYYRSGPSYESYGERPYYSPPRTYHERPPYRTSSYDDRPVYRSNSYSDGPAYHTTYYRRYDERSYDRSYHSYRPHYRSYSSHYDRPYYSTYRPTTYYGGAWQQTGYPSYAYGGCHSAYIPYGWTWYRARSC